MLLKQIFFQELFKHGSNYNIQLTYSSTSTFIPTRRIVRWHTVPTLEKGEKGSVTARTRSEGRCGYMKHKSWGRLTWQWWTQSRACSSKPIKVQHLMWSQMWTVGCGWWGVQCSPITVILGETNLGIRKGAVWEINTFCLILWWTQNGFEAGHVNAHLSS